METDGLNPQQLVIPNVNDAEMIAIVLNTTANEAGSIMFNNQTYNKMGFITASGALELIDSA